ncbi:killer cell lectin-like receptor subfamily G member 1 [Polypterus senegalus]|uniref:killer cell lectin-like receptor subfamily G member 1 n=1 Tax=Polypterus senegalus TaxID=55291 RepID=UPI001965039B|nr:killer cell lectin-like receptor subfamily G member 1 [Polypterus senegalus]
MPSDDIYCKEEEIKVRRKDAELQRCCNHKKWTVIAVFLSGCIIVTYRVIEYKFIICQQNKTTTSPGEDGNTIYSNTEEGQWLKHNGKSYYFATEKRSWDNANTFCRKQSSNLTMIKSTEELNFIKNHTVTEIWIGLRKENEKWNWIDRTTFQNNIFKEGIQQVKAGMDCVMIMKTGLMYAVPCKTRYHWNPQSMGLTEEFYDRVEEVPKTSLASDSLQDSLYKAP